MKKALIVFLLLFIAQPALGSDDVLRASIVQKLLNQFVAQVNLLEEIQTDIASAKNPSGFQSFKNVLTRQLSFTTSQLASLLNPLERAIPAHTNNTNNSTPTSNPSPIATPDTVAPRLEVTKVVDQGLQDNGFRRFQLNVAYFDGDESVKDKQITLSDGEITVKRNAGTGITENGKTTWYAIFHYNPKSEGTKNLTFSAGNTWVDHTIEAIYEEVITPVFTEGEGRLSYGEKTSVSIRLAEGNDGVRYIVQSIDFAVGERNENTNMYIIGGGNTTSIHGEGRNGWHNIQVDLYKGDEIIFRFDDGQGPILKPITINAIKMHSATTGLLQEIQGLPITLE